MLIVVQDPQAIDETALTRGSRYCAQLEEGHILLLPQTMLDLPDDDRRFLLSQQHAVAASHKNIAFRPDRNRLAGFVERRSGDADRLRAILRAYSARVTQLVTQLLPPYAAWLRVDLASFRPEDEERRDLRLRERNDLLHVDAFPSRPTNGDRILRVFTNLNQTRSRRWISTDGFEALLAQSAESRQLRLPKPAAWARRALIRLARAAGLPARSPYDAFMLRFHDFLKQEREFQAGCVKQTYEFPPGSTWIVFTDGVPHAAVAGQYALEQTFFVAPEGLVAPAQAPLRILERLCGAPLTFK
ncbi:MAG TPA: Kdo hydroxylase family protein [Candidatus Kryptonia bacterium]|nr:Kdo hydroxylase family protein [Candidatus Kryptonia bacterium]